MTPTITTANRLSLPELLDVWNRGFSGYYVDNTMDEQRLAKHIRWSGVDLSRSAVLLVDGKPAAFSLAATARRGGGLAAWIAGFGVAPEHRRQGLAGQVMRAHLEMLDGAGVRETSLEVIDVNPARRVYAAAGFAPVRSLFSFQGVPQPLPGAAGSEAVVLPAARLEELHGALHTRLRPPWRRELPTLLRIVDDEESAQVLAIMDDEEVADAYALVIAGKERAALLDAVAADAAAARRLVSSLAERFAGKSLRIIDEPENSPLMVALAEAGLQGFLCQIEMVRAV